MVIRRILLVVLCVTCLMPVAISQGYVQYGHTTQANIDMTLNNLGIIGNSFRGVYNDPGYGSLEYPRGSSKEHVFNGGLWVGGKFPDGGIAVSTGAIGSSAGYATGAKGFEFTAAQGAQLIQKSTLLDNEFYAGDAVSHQDLVGDFTDKNTLIPGSTQAIVGHVQPLGLDIHMEAYNWNFSSTSNYIPVTFTIKNSSASRIDSVWVGFWCDFVVRDVSINPPGGSPFFSSGGNGYVDSLQMAYELDGEKITQNSRGYAGLKFLGATDVNGTFRHPKISHNFRCNYNTWLFSSGSLLYLAPSNDNEYYARLKKGLNYETSVSFSTIQTQILAPSNRSNLISVGPFASIESGESITVTFAVLCAVSVNDGKNPWEDTPQQRSDLTKAARAVQQSFNGEDANFDGKLNSGEDANGNGKLDRWVFPEPPAIPKTKIIAGDEKIELYWTDNSINSIDPITKQKDFEGFRIYKTQVGFDMQSSVDIDQSLKLIASFDIAGDKIGFDNGFDSVRLSTPVTFDNDTNIYTHKYVIKNALSGWQHAISLTAFDKGNDTLDVASMESSKTANLFRVFPGKPANSSITTSHPYVYPNPYYGLASWETWQGAQRIEENRKIIFANLPAICHVKIYTWAGDLVDEFDHNQQWTGSDLGKGVSGKGWFNQFSDTKQTVFSGGEHAWDLLSANSQFIARGLYLFSVEDLSTGNTYPGKFVIIK